MNVGTLNSQIVRVGGAAFLSLLCWPCLAESVTPQMLFARAAPQVAVVEAMDEDGAMISTHSAVAIGSRKFVTTCEVISGAAKVSLVMPAGRGAALLARRDAKRNLCLLEAPDAPDAGIAMRDSPPRTGERAYAVSNGLGLGVGITEGVVSGVRNFDGETYIQFTAAIAPGSEGGALLDAEGRLLGVIDYRRRDGQNINFAVPVQGIADIGSREVSDEGRGAMRDHANALARRRQWTDLAELAARWTQAYPEDADAWLWYAGSAEVLGDQGKAESGYREVRRLEPASLKAGLGLSRLLVRSKKYDEALAIARGLLAGRQEDPDVWLAIGQVELSMGKLDAAEQSFRRTVGIFPWASQAHLGLAAIAEQRQDAEALVAVWRQLADLQPGDRYTQLRLAEAFMRQGRPARALVVTERVLQSDPEDADAWFWKGVVLVKLERPMAAIDAFKRSLAGKPYNPGWVWCSLADTYYGLQLWRESVAAYRESVKIEPEPAGCRYKLGLVYKDSFEFDEAMAIFREHAKLYPSDPAGWRQIGFVHGFRGQVTDSIAALEHSLNLDSKQVQVWLALVDQYHKAGRHDDMRRAYQQLRLLDRAQADRAYLWFLVPTEVTP